MRIFVAVCGALLLLAIAYAVISIDTHTQLFALFRWPPDPQRLAWVFVILASLTLLGSALWLSEQLLRQRKATEMLESRLQLEESQKDADRAANHLARTDPDPALSALQQRLSSAEQTARIQQQRHEASDLQTRIEQIRERQNVLREKLGQVIEKRQSIQQLLAEYEGTQHEIERILSGIEEDKTAEPLEARIARLSQFTKVSDSRFEELERSKQMLLNLREEFDGLQSRLLPLKDDHGGIKALLHQLNDTCAQLGANIDALDRDGDSRLAERIKRISDHKRELSERVSSLVEEFSKIDDSHKEITTLFTKLSGDLKTRYSSPGA